MLTLIRVVRRPSSWRTEAIGEGLRAPCDVVGENSNVMLLCSGTIRDTTCPLLGANRANQARQANLAQE